MKITKYEHSFVTLEEAGQTLVIDPGMFSPELPSLTNVKGIVLTHEHQDHVDTKNLNAIIAANPDVLILAPAEVLDQLDALQASKQPVTPGEGVEVGAFRLEFFGGKHAVVYKTSPCANVGVLINDTFYYPGDSYDAPDKPVNVLAVPISGPWSKTSESMDFLLAVKPKIAFPTHDRLLSEVGAGLQSNWLGQAAKEAGAEWRDVKVGESLEV